MNCVLKKNLRANLLKPSRQPPETNTRDAALEFGVKGFQLLIHCTTHGDVIFFRNRSEMLTKKISRKQIYGGTNTSQQGSRFEWRGGIQYCCCRCYLRKTDFSGVNARINYRSVQLIGVYFSHDRSASRNARINYRCAERPASRCLFLS